MSQAPKVLVCDDHPVIVIALRSELARIGQFSEVVTASSVNEILNALNDPEVGIVITDFSLNEAGDGLQLIGRIKRLRPDVAVIVFSMNASPPAVRDMIAAGASAFVSKTCGTRDVAEACRVVLAGRKFVAPASLAHLLDQDDGRTPQAALQQLSPREREVLRLLAQGLSLREIAARFNRSRKTISVQKCAAMAKLGLTHDMELGRYLASADSDEP